MLRFQKVAMSHSISVFRNIGININWIARKVAMLAPASFVLKARLI